jgi:HEAT repeat protein
LAAQVAMLGALAAMPISAQRPRPAQPPPSQTSSVAIRLAILAAEDRRAMTPRDLATIRAGTRSADGQIVRIAVRALGRLERPELIADIIPGLRQPFPEVRAEAANALAQAARGWTHRPPASSPRTMFDAASTALVARLRVEPDGNVRSAIADAIGRLPYASVE